MTNKQKVARDSILRKGYFVENGQIFQVEEIKNPPICELLATSSGGKKFLLQVYRFVRLTYPQKERCKTRKPIFDDETSCRKGRGVVTQLKQVR